MTARQDVMKLAAELGATVEAESDHTGFNIRVEAPEGTHWDEGIHELVAFQFKGFNTEGMWKDLLLRMKEGTDKCTDECEWWE